MIDIITVPDGFKQGIGETKCQDILHRFLTQVMIYAVYLLFIKHGGQQLVQCMSALQVLSERFFHYDAAAFRVGADIQWSQLYSYRWHKLRRHGHIKYYVRMLAKFGFLLFYDFSNALVFIFVVYIELQVIDML